PMAAAKTVPEHAVMGEVSSMAYGTGARPAASPPKSAAYGAGAQPAASTPITASAMTATSMAAPAGEHKGAVTAGRTLAGGGRSARFFRGSRICHRGIRQQH